MSRSPIRELARRAVVASMLLAASACSHVSGGVAPSNIPIAPGSYEVLGEVRGNDCQVNLFSFIPLSNGNETKTALQDALEEKKADALIQITSDTYSQNWILFSRTCTQVNATAVRFK